MTVHVLGGRDSSHRVWTGGSSGGAALVQAAERICSVWASTRLGHLAAAAASCAGLSVAARRWMRNVFGAAGSMLA